VDRRIFGCGKKGIALAIRNLKQILNVSSQYVVRAITNL
jgi:hypothetical protein